MNTLPTLTELSRAAALGQANDSVEASGRGYYGQHHLPQNAFLAKVSDLRIVGFRAE